MSLPAQENKQQNNDNSKYNFRKENVLKTSNAAKILGVSPSTLRRFEEEGLISSYRDPGNDYRFYRLDLIKSLKRDLESKNLKKSFENTNTKEVLKISEKIIVKTPNQVITNKPQEPTKTADSLKINIFSKTESTEKIKNSDSKKRIEASYDDKITQFSKNQFLKDVEDKISGPLLKKARFGVIFLTSFFVISLGLTYLSSKGILSEIINSDKISSVLGLGTKKEIANENSVEKVNRNVLAARTRVSDFIQNFNLPTFFKQKSTFEAGLDVTDITFIDTATMNGLLGIDATTKNTLEQSLSIDGDVVGTNMLSTVIKEGVIDGTKLAPEISYEGSFDFLNGSLLIDGTPIEATAEELNVLSGIQSTVDELNILSGVQTTAEELNILSGVQTTTEELNYLSGMTVENGGILFGDGNAISQDPSALFWDTTTGSLEIGNGSNFTGFRASDSLVLDLIYT